MRGKVQEDLASSSRPTVIQGEFQKISFQNSDNGWTVARVRTADNESAVTVVGHFGQVALGEHYEMHGEWVENQKYGRQFKVSHWNLIYPQSLAGILRYLRSGIVKGVGEVTAERIVDHFGTQTLEVLDTDPDRLLEIPKIGKKKKKEIIKAWNDRKRYRDVEIFLSTLGVTPAFINRILRVYGEDAPRRIQEDPYSLARDVGGIGFLTADGIASHLGVAPDSPLRIKAAITYQLEQAEEQGHCYQTKSQLIELLVNLLKIARTRVEDLLEASLNELLEEETVVFDEDRVSGTDIYYRQQSYAAEETVAYQTGMLLRNPMPPESEERIERWLKSYSAASGQPFSFDQLEAVKKAVRNRVFVLTGGPGVGKTTTANAIIRLLVKMNRSVALAAPTGRAAQRLSEVAAIGAKTIHRLLEWSAGEHNFLRDEINPLDAQVIIVDEASMLDIHLASALLKALKPDAQVIFIGDVDQLPSVGPGNVLRDLIDSGVVPFTKLSQIFRQAAGSAIVQVAHQINRGDIPVFPEVNTSDCQFLTIEDPAAIKDVIKTLVNETLPSKGSWDPIRDIQVLTPMNRGPLGTQLLNEELQALLNPSQAAAQKLKTEVLALRPGDKVIQTVNNYELNVFNGDIGFVELAGFDGGQVLVNFGDRQVSYSKEDAFDLKLAYAITIHKSQGSEFPVVIIPVSMQHFIMLQRNLIYTALTRARKLAILVGTASALQQAIKTQTSRQRQTMLIDRLVRMVPRKDGAL